jgi:hypothetical protein
MEERACTLDFAARGFSSDPVFICVNLRNLRITIFADEAAKSEMRPQECAAQTA